MTLLGKYHFTGFEHITATSVIGFRGYNKYPFGLTLPDLSYQASGTTNLLKYNGKELQEDHGLNLYDYGARLYDGVIGRFGTQDRFVEKYYDMSSYQYALNNPIRYIDINGDSAWSVKRNWNENDSKNFANFAEQKLKGSEGKNIDCADLSLNVLIDYASENGLPLEIFKTDGTAFNSNSDKYNNVDEYKYGYKVEGSTQKKGGVLAEVGARDIASNTFTMRKDEAQPGDMIILTKPYNHIVNLSQTNPKVQLTYGNIGEPVKTIKKDWTKYSDDASGITYTDSKGVVYKYNPNNKTVHRWKFLKP